MRFLNCVIIVLTDDPVPACHFVMEIFEYSSSESHIVYGIKCDWKSTDFFFRSQLSETESYGISFNNQKPHF